MVVVDQVLIAESDAEDPLAHQGADPVLHRFGRAVVSEAGGEALDQADGTIGSTEQQRTGIGGDRPTIEGGNHLPSLDRCKAEPLRATVCWHWGAPLWRASCCGTTTFAHSAPRCTYSCEKWRLDE
jgi:hypothetical protein